MANDESSLDRLWDEYSQVFRDFDDLSLGRWLAQTLGQLEGRLWRLSDPLIGAFRLAAQLAHERQIWLKRLSVPPSAYPEAACCRAPLLPMFTRDVLESGLICQHCTGTAVAFDDLPPDLQPRIRRWAEDYAPVHGVAHWEDSKRRSVGNYDRAYEDAAEAAEKLLAVAGRELLPPLLEHYPALIWEDQDDCLEVRPEDVET
jgi:hypothetical protein